MSVHEGARPEALNCTDLLNDRWEEVIRLEDVAA